MSVPKIDNVDVVVYHSPCSDGYGAAWVFYNKFGSGVEYLPGSYSEDRYNSDYWVAKVTGKRVVVVDFSFPRDLTEELHDAAKSFTVLDHHPSAQEALEDFDYCYFESEKSGAMMAWEACHGEKSPAKLVEYVQDQDLWIWSLPSCHEICTYINGQPRDFLIWDSMAEALEDEVGRESAHAKGKAIMRKEDTLASEIVENAEEWELKGYTILAANTSVLRNEVNIKLAEQGEYPFLACYWIKNGAVTWSMRVREGDVDVSAIASSFPGGGGHKKAAGFTISVNEVDFINRTVG